MYKIKQFFKTPFGRKVEKALWEMSVIALNLAIVYATEFNVAFLIASIPVMTAITKYINTTFLKD